MTIELRGITWDHPRGFDPVQATAAAYGEAHPDVRIRWERRTLRDFAERSVLDLADHYDFIVLDHPWIGAASERRCLLPLDEWLPAQFLADQASNSVGKSYESYVYGGHLWALPIDAAAQVSAYRADLLQRHRLALPSAWEQVFALARRLPAEIHIAIALMPVDTWPVFVSVSNSFGEAPLQSGDQVVARHTGREALKFVQALLKVSHPGSINWNPPQLLDHMSRTDEIAYCPLLFGYSNYARPGFRPNLVHFTNIPPNRDGVPAGAILGGAGLAVSSKTRFPAEACKYAQYVASAPIQKTIYFRNAGQPGHRTAWLDVEVNESSSGFFLDTLATLDNAFLRPRYDGYIRFQDAACQVLHQFLCGGAEAEMTLERLDAAYRDSLKH
jgi:multiple sugar transport system substrate-binding protein